MIATCCHGIECDYVYRKTVIGGEEIVTGGDYWHSEDERCVPYPTPPIIGTDVRVFHSNGAQSYVAAVVGFDPSDGAVEVEGGELVANHLDDSFSRFEVLR